MFVPQNSLIRAGHVIKRPMSLRCWSSLADTKQTLQEHCHRKNVHVSWSMDVDTVCLNHQAQTSMACSVVSATLTAACSCGMADALATVHCATSSQSSPSQPCNQLLLLRSLTRRLHSAMVQMPSRREQLVRVSMPVPEPHVSKSGRLCQLCLLAHTSPLPQKKVQPCGNTSQTMRIR